MNEIIISNIDPQNIVIGEGGTTGITTVYVNGVDVTVNNVAYVVVPTKTSELQNNSGYITQEQDPTVPSYVKKIKLSDITNWNNKQNELVSGQNIKTINNESLLGSGNINVDTSYTAGTGIQITDENVINNTITSYDDLSDLPTIPTKTSELQNDSDYVTSNALSNVAFSGSYLDLSNTPDLSIYATLDTKELLNYFTKDYFFKILPKLTGTGSNINLNPTVDGTPIYLSLGATELTQDGTPTPSNPQEIHTISGNNTIKVEGKNLFDISQSSLGQILNTGNGTTGSGGATVDTSDYIKVESNKTYVLKGTTDEGTYYYNYYICLYDTNKTFVERQNMTSLGDKAYSFTPSQDGYIRFTYVHNITNLQLEINTTATTYAPYVSQEADIDLGNIEYCKIGNYEDKFIRTTGKNLFDKSTALTDKLVNASNGNVGNDTGTTASDFIYIKGLDSIILSGTTVSYGNGGAFYDDNKTYVSGFSSSALKNGLSIPNNVSYIRFNTLNTAVDTTMLNKGSTALPYEPYGSNEWYIKKNIGKVVLDGTENWGQNTAQTLTNTSLFYTALIDSTLNVSQTIKSNYFNYTQIWSIDIEGIYGYSGGNDLRIRINTTTANDVASFKTWLSTNNTTVYYILSTPTYTPITGTLAEQLEYVYKNMLSQTGVTNISQINNDLAFTITATTLKDLSSY